MDAQRRLVELRVGQAEVFVEVPMTDADLVGTTDLRAAAGGSHDAFARAMGFLRECVHMVDDRLHELERRPDEMTIEFSLGFDLKGKATLVPVLVSSEGAARSAVKVTATWSAGRKID
jgi:hypothetical protein